ncbi:GNAT family N-acetyltransferase [candidate division WOR-3 bacterium]|uniref:GNAT family N-acetyltransferase n=1 Tax=candidate division WOR-3 bacterium TaxID=2052148 RepID=A0A937XAU8_UNCW3|nr:GNAT family N-acetyltransferase [candidate division WOR-3 bacterium]
MTAPGVVFSLRQATCDDSEFAFEVKKLTLGGYVRQVWGWDEQEQRRLHDRRFGSQDFQVIESSGCKIGILALSHEPGCLKVNQLLLLPEHQGKGIGTACMSRVIAQAASHGLPVRLQVLKVNRRAVEFYCRLGFRGAGADGTHIRMEKPAR